jgi:choline-glycine betaine transporter
VGPKLIKKTRNKFHSEKRNILLCLVSLISPCSYLLSQKKTAQAKPFHNTLRNCWGVIKSLMTFDVMLESDRKLVVATKEETKARRFEVSSLCLCLSFTLYEKFSKKEDKRTVKVF